MTTVESVKRRLMGALPGPLAAELRRRRGRATKKYQDRAVRRSAHRSQTRFIRALGQPLDENLVLYESFSGNGMLCNPEAIFRELLAAEDLRHLRHVWVLDDVRRHSLVVQKYRSDSRVSFVTYKSTEYYERLARAKFLVNNATFPNEFTKRPDQVYVNTWHGTPLKKMGYSIPGGRMDTRNIVRNFLSADFLLSANPFMTEEMYLNGYRMRDLYPGTILETGYPRIDHQFDPDVSTEFRLLLAETGIEVGERKVLLYAPTWRGESFYNPNADSLSLDRAVAAMEAALPDDYVVLIKAHQVVYQALSEDPRIAHRLVSNDIPTNVALGGSEILVSDYSSIFFDYLVSERPIFFYIPDLASYSSARGLYLEPEELPGPVARTTKQLRRQLDEHFRQIEDPWSARRAEWRARFCSADDGGAASRVVDACWRSGRAGVVETTSSGRTKVLFYAGGMITNGITTSMLNLLNSLDPARFDVSIVFSYTRAKAKLENVDAIPDHVRIMPRSAGLTRSALAEDNLQFVRGETDEPQWELWRHEWRRLFGGAQFDHVVDFSGYSPYWATLLLAGGGRRSVWLHNDLMADAQREVDGERPHFENLNAMFRLYRHFEDLVSVSESLSEINAANLVEFAPADRFRHARNSIDAGRILAGAHGEGLVAAVAEPRHLIVDADLDLREAVAALRHAYPVDSVLREVERQSVIAEYLPHASGKTFVCVGRLSPEKNHARLLNAFAEVHQHDSAARLVIIGGGPLLDSTAVLASNLGVGEAVTFTGVLGNPWALMGGSDCFVLSSDYEGQPMVILEARTLGLPVISTRFASAVSAVPPAAGVLVDQDSGSLARAMIGFLDEGIAHESFDPAAYNREVIEEFVNAIGIG